MRALPVGEEVDGVARTEPVDLGPLEAPDVALVEGQPWVVAVEWSGEQESILLIRGEERERLFSGERAWAPRIATGGGQTFVTWVGRERGSGFDNRVYLHQVGVETRVVAEGERHGNPALDVSDTGEPALAFERHEQVQSWTRDGVEVHGGRMAFRPSVLWHEGALHVAWDVVHPDRSGQTEPRYSVRYRKRTDEGWEEEVAVDAPETIAAAPALLPHPDGVMVAYHRSLPMGVVKWPALRLVRDGEVLASEPIEVPTPEGENQGAEFVEPVVNGQGGVVMVARSSQGAVVLAGDKGWDLTRNPWGARGVRAGAVLDGRTLTIARKARTSTILETLTLPPVGPPKFYPVEPQRPTSSDPLPANPDGPFFGDVHMHTAIGDGTGPPDEIYARAYARGLDFAIITEHDFVLGSRLLPSEQEVIAWWTERFDLLDGFTTLHAYEWTTPPLFRDGSGHRNAYFRGMAPSPAPSHKGTAPDTNALWEALRDEQVFTAPHHTTWTGTDWEDADPAIQRHLELISVHGLNEAPWQTEIPPRGDQESGFASVGLEIVPFGFLGGSDAHGLLWHHGIGRKADPWAHGLTGVIAPENSREALWDAMYAQQTFATSGSRTVALTRLEGTVVRWDAQGTALSQVQVVTGEGVVHTQPVSGTQASGSFDVAGARYVYVRVVDQIEDLPELAWSSPLFLQETP